MWKIMNLPYLTTVSVSAMHIFPPIMGVAYIYCDSLPSLTLINYQTFLFSRSYSKDSKGDVEGHYEDEEESGYISGKLNSKELMDREREEEQQVRAAIINNVEDIK